MGTNTSTARARLASPHGEGARDVTLSVIIPTYRREQVLLDTLGLVQGQLRPGDELLVVDQTPAHEPETERALLDLAARRAIRWFRKARPSQNEAMNAASHLARGNVLVFLDDDVIPVPGQLEAYRAAFAQDPNLVVANGQTLQPWNPGPSTEQPRAFDYRFNFAGTVPCEMLSLIACNFAIRRATYQAVGGMDENFNGANYRNDAELAYRVYRRTGHKVGFLPAAGVRHLLARGGNRAFGGKDTWGSIGASVGDYYFALRSLHPLRAAAYSAWRVVRAPVCRNTMRRPWIIPLLLVRELCALGIAVLRTASRRDKLMQPLERYTDLSEILPASVEGSQPGPPYGAAPDS